MKNSPLQLEQLVLTGAHVDANLTAKVDGPVEWRIQSKINVAGHKTEPRRWKVDLSVEFAGADEANSPYRGSASFSGLFLVADTYPEDKIQFLVKTNGPSVLYGAARETVANLTARGPWPMVMLPTQSFYEPKPAQPAPAPSIAPGTKPPGQ